MRMSMDEAKMAELVESIRALGILEPILVVERVGAELPGDGGKETAIGDSQSPGLPRYEILDGHRRWIAAGAADLEVVPVRIFPVGTTANYAVMAHANLMRESVTAAEEGLQYLELSERHGWSLSQIMKQFCRSENYVNERVRLVHDFPDVSAAVAERKISFAQGKQIMRCPNPSQRGYLIDQACTHGASARALGYMVDQFKSAELVAAGGQPLHTPEHAAAFVQSAEKECVWCARRDDQRNMVDVPVHAYHKRDLADLLNRLGVNGTSRQIVSS